MTQYSPLFSLITINFQPCTGWLRKFLFVTYIVLYGTRKGKMLDISVNIPWLWLVMSWYCCSNSTSDCLPYIAPADLPQGAKYFYVALVTSTTQGDILICLGLAFGAIMLQTGLALQKKEENLGSLPGWCNCSQNCSEKE